MEPVIQLVIRRSIDEPIRLGLRWDQRWRGPDGGLIWCWERGRQMRLEDPGLAQRAADGELVLLAWKGGVSEKLKNEKKPKLGTLFYIATWLGLRLEDLDISTRDERIVTCAKTHQDVAFSATLPDDDDE